MANDLSKSERTRRYIIETTAPIFNKKGYAGTSMSDLTQATGLTKGAIYGNFKNKDEVALEAFDYNLSKITVKLREWIKARTTAIEKLMVYPEYYRSNYKSDLFEGGCPLLNTAAEADDTHRALHNKVSKAFTLWHETVQHIIEKGIAFGQIKQEIDPEQYATIFVSMIEGGMLLTHTTRDPRFLFQALDRLETIIRTELAV